MSHVTPDFAEVGSRSLSEEADFAVDLARRAGRLTLEHFQGGVETHFKTDGSPVTVADRQAEELMRQEIRRRCPDDSIIGEEFDNDEGGSGWRWILDPIDGTASFVRGVPLFGVLIGLEAGGETKLGVIHLPALGETVWAWRGGGCWWNGRPTRVSRIGEVDKSLLCLTRIPGAPLDRLVEAAGLRRTWGDCYGYALVATGRAEIMVDAVVDVWDVAAVQPIIEEAGGRFSDLAGVATIRGGHSMATNGLVHDEALELIR